MKHFNFILALVTIGILGLIGILFIVGTVYSSIQPAYWTQTPVYAEYIEVMNASVIPLVLALVVVLGLCIPKRLFDGKDLIIVTIALLGATAILGIATDVKTAIGFLLVIASLIQTLVIVLTLIGSKRVSYEKSGFFVQVGSALLHLGLIIFVLDFVNLAEHPSHLAVFWVATALIGVGMVFTFYSREIAGLARREQNAQNDIAEE